MTNKSYQKETNFGGLLIFGHQEKADKNKEFLLFNSFSLGAENKGILFLATREIPLKEHRLISIWKDERATAATPTTTHPP
jgi:hypothetical protein